MACELEQVCGAFLSSFTFCISRPAWPSLGGLKTEHFSGYIDYQNAGPFQREPRIA